MAKDFRKHHPRMSKARIISEISLRSYIIEFDDNGGEHKRHYDQMIH